MAVLKVLNGDDAEKSLKLHGERSVLGRHPNCQVVLENVAVSRHHAQILESHGTFYLEDLRSRNGTYLNGQAVEGRVQLNDQDQIRICDVLVRFQNPQRFIGLVDTHQERVTPKRCRGAAPHTGGRDD